MNDLLIKLVDMWTRVGMTWTEGAEGAADIDFSYQCEHLGLLRLNLVAESSEEVPRNQLLYRKMVLAVASLDASKGL